MQFDIDADYFTLLPREYYLSEEIYEKEVKRIFFRQWQYVGHVSQLPNAGDFFVTEIVGESLILSRDREGVIRAMHNVCRHRGYPVCLRQSGNTRSFVCGYHNWSYGVDGRLRKAPSIDDGDYVDYNDLGLVNARVEVWGGFIFVCLGDPLTPSVGVELDRVAQDMKRLEPEKLKIAKEITYEVEGNWKIFLENSLECYHCVGGHPELTAAMDLSDSYRLLNDRRSSSQYFGGGLPPRPGAVSITPDGQPVSKKLLGEFGRGVPTPEAFHAGFGIQPTMSRALFFVDYGSINFLKVQGPDRVVWVQHFYVHEDAVEGVDYDLAKLVEIFDLTIEQDLGFVALAAKGVKSRSYVPGPLSAAREPALRGALSEYFSLMGEG